MSVKKIFLLTFFTLIIACNVDDDDLINNVPAFEWTFIACEGNYGSIRHRDRRLLLDNLGKFRLHVSHHPLGKIRRPDKLLHRSDDQLLMQQDT